MTKVACKRGSAKEMEKMILRALLLAICMDLGHGQKMELFFQQNRNFFSFFTFTEAPISATSNQSLSKGSDTSPCLQPTFCYQVMSVRRVAVIESQMKDGSAAAIFYPQNASLSPVALSYVLQEKTNQPDSSRVVYVSGRMETQSFWLTLKFPSIPDFTMVFVPTPKVNYPPSPPVWINWGNLTITETTAAASGSGTTNTLYALLCFLAVKTLFF
nr:unnamed protein product [Spirometra erinaceieuropaei]